MLLAYQLVLWWSHPQSTYQLIQGRGDGVSEPKCYHSVCLDPSVNRIGKRVCDVCNTEKLQILRHMGPRCVNLRSELNNKCLHSRKHKLEKAGRATRK